MIEFDLVHRHRRLAAIEVEQVAQCYRLLLVDQLGVFLVGGVGVARDRVLQLVDLRPLERMALATPAVAIEPADRQGRVVLVIGARMQSQHLVLDAGETDARDPGDEAGEVLGAQRAGQADRLEVVAAAIARQDRDAHLRHDLEQALVDRLLVVGERLLQREPRQQAARGAIGDRRLGEIGVDRRGADPDQHRDVVHVEALAGAHRDRAEAAQALAHEMAVHGAGGEDHRHRRTRLRARLVAQHDLLVALAHRVLGLEADPGKAVPQGPRPGLDVKGAVERCDLAAEVVEQRCQLVAQQQRALELQDAGLARRLVVDVAEIAVARLEAHDPILAQRVDRRVGDLAELLAEEVMQAAIAGRQHRHRRVVAHRAERLLAFLRHRREQQLELLDRDAEQVVPAAQLAALHLHRRDRTLGGQVVEVGDVLDPLSERLLPGEQILQLAVTIELAGLQIDADHLAGADPTLLDDLALGQRHHAGLGADHQEPVGRAVVAHRAQAVPVHAADHPVAIARHDAGRAVPGLHHAVAIAEEILVRLGDRHLLGPGRRDQQGLGERQRAPTAHQRLDHRVERRAVGAAGLDDRLDLLVVVAERRRHHAGLVALHPVQIAPQRVDLAVVGEHPERLRKRPGRPGVGRIALVKNGKARDEALVLQIGVEHRELFGEEQPLVDHRPAGQGADVEAVDVLGQHLLLDPAPDDEQLALELGIADAFGIAENDLLDLGPGRDRLIADHGRVDRHLAPAQDRVPETQHLGLDDRPAALLAGEVGARQEYHADRDAAVGVLAAADLLAQEVLRDLEVDPGAVAGLAVGVDRTAMPDRAQRVDRGRDHAAARLTVDRGDEADPAGGMLVGRIVHPLARQMVGIAPPLVDEALAFGHGRSPQEAIASAGARACRY